MLLFSKRVGNSQGQFIVFSHNLWQGTAGHHLILVAAGRKDMNTRAILVRNSLVVFAVVSVERDKKFIRGWQKADHSPRQRVSLPINNLVDCPWGEFHSF